MQTRRTCEQDILLEASKAGGYVSQLRDAMDFLQEERDEILRLVAFPGIENVEFRMGLFWWSDTLCQFHSIPADFLQIAGNLGVAITLCVYSASGNKPEAESSDTRNDAPSA